MIRRILGIAHVADFERITDLKMRSEREIKALRMGRRLIVESDNITTIDKVIEIAREINN